MPTEPRDLDNLATYNDYVYELKSRLLDIQTLARQNQIMAKEKSKEYYDRKIHPVLG